MKQKYDPAKIEPKWQKIWAQEGFQKAIDFKKPKFYCLDMFPYPSGEGLHVGHWRGYVLSDVWTRYQKLKDKNVLHPMGFDAFGLPAENAAIAQKTHPRIFTDNAIKKFKKQLAQIGSLYDWDREVNTSKAKYYKWTQWLFLQLYKAGLAYRKKAEVNFCPSCQTVLANEQVVSGECERCGAEVIKKELKQWFFKITKYADRLLEDLEKIDWPERTKILQKNWIGKSEGTEIIFKIADTKYDLPTFTTRSDTLFGATYVVMAPEHSLVSKITTTDKKQEVEKYIEKTKKLSEIERTKTEREKTGVFIGAEAINPANGEKVPIWISDYVLLHYGTGAIMCVPAHDLRDFKFAKKFGLPIKQVITPGGKKQKELKEAYTAAGVMVNSDEFNGRYSKQGTIAITKWLEKKGVGRKTTSYRLRDWLVSRQRYWGTPIPIIYCSKCGEVPVPEKDLPVKLPEKVDFKPTGKSPLENSKEFLNVKCPKCSGPAERETDTLDTFVCSSWYFLRYCDPKNSAKPFDPKKVNFWMPTDLYIGGIEHATMHLLYARFISKVLHDLDRVNFDPAGEPFKKLFNIGMIYCKGSKMAKRKGNIVSPEELIEKYGTDSLRGYELFIGPADQDAEWMDDGIKGIARFLNKVWEADFRGPETPFLHQTIKKVTDDIKSFKSNTAISALMIYLDAKKGPNEKFLILMAPFFPHIAEELWKRLGYKNSIFEENWPEYDKKLVRTERVLIIIQVNGKLRDKIEVTSDSSEKNIVAKAQETEKISKWLSGKKIKKTIYVSNRLVNFVV